MKEQNNHDEVLGITKDGELVVVEYTFKQGGLQGATGWHMGTLTQDQIDAQSDLDYIKDSYGHIWQEAVAAGGTELGLDDYVKELIEAEEYNPDTYYLGDDPSFRYETDEAVAKLSEADQKKIDEIMGVKGKDFVDWSVGGCGRCIPLDEAEYQVIFNPDLLAECRKYEGK